MRFIDLTDQPFGRLTAKRYLGKSRWECVCQCGNTHAVDAYHLRSGAIQSCGCLQREAVAKMNAERELVPFSERFWAKVNKGGPVPSHQPELGPCWVWTAKTNHDGYGQIREGGEGTPFLQAHRANWVFANGPIPDGLWVLHRCDNPLCVRPAHLFLGTASDNTRDAMRKGRMAIGEANSRAKLSDSDVVLIRHKYQLALAAGRRHREIVRSLAPEFEISERSIEGIVNGETWRHVAAGVADGNLRAEIFAN
jgi:hypothetical protein